jgi:23S rRNA (adenine2503-C2)-methyltransferase
MDIHKIEKYIIQNKIPNFRLKQIKQAFFVESKGGWSEVSTLSKDLQKELSKNFSWFSFKSAEVKQEAKTKTKKAIFKLADDQIVETVLLKSKTGHTVCVSSQVGCQMNCAFCATGQSGYARNLTAEEIVDQVVFWNNQLKATEEWVTSIVFMGMGEPFMNWPEVKKAILILSDSDGLNIGLRHISVSTCGIADKIADFARTFPQSNLAVSLHSANPRTRSELMPANRIHSLSSLIEQCLYYVEDTKRKLFFEYAFIDGVNDDDSAVMDLINLIKKHYLFHLNIIPYNKTSAQYRPTRDSRLSQIIRQLEKNRVSFTVRKSAGSDVLGACGQLSRGKKFEKKRDIKK